MFRLAKKPRPGLALLTLIPAFLILSFFSFAHSTSAPAHAPERITQLQAVAQNILGAREGAIVVLDPQTGRIKAIVNSELAFKGAFPPGSTIKPFTTLAALRAGVITEHTRIRCRGKYKRDACVHPPKLPPFNATEAIAYSCNYFFATTGERMDRDKFSTLLGEFGFGPPAGRWQPQSALGEGPFLQVTPIQMATAYAALFNGGALLKPNYDGVPTVRAQLHLEDDERSLLLEGMRGAVSFGTAEKANLDSLPVYIVGKTGTSTQLGSYRTQGWFAGIAFKPNTAPEPGNAELLVVVYLKNAHGSEAAELARPIFAEFAGKRSIVLDRNLYYSGFAQKSRSRSSLCNCSVVD